MLNIYFDNVLINEDAIAELTNSYQIYTNNFYLGGIASNTFNLKCGKQFISSQPTQIKIEDDNSTHYLGVQKIEESEHFYEYELADEMMNFNFMYDAQPLIDDNRDVDGESTTKISDIFSDICYQAGVTTNTTLQTTDHIIDFWDNRISARDYISMIAEKEGSFARAENGELVLVPVKTASKKTISTDAVDELIVGDKIKISRVVYDNGLLKWERGSDTDNTLYLYPNNVFLLEENDIEEIYNLVNGFEFYSTTVNRCPIDSTILAGDIITFTDSRGTFPTIAQYNLSYFGDWRGGYSLDLSSVKQDETTNLGIYDSVKSIRTIVDRTNASLSIIAEQTETIKNEMPIINESLNILSDNIGKIDDEIHREDGITDQLEYLSSQQTQFTVDLEGVKASQQFSGGYNLIENCVKQFGQSGWNGDYIPFSNTEIRNNSLAPNALVFMNGIEEREFQVENRVHNFSFKYKKLINLAQIKITVNDIELELTEFDRWVTVDTNINVTSNNIKIKYECDTDNALWLVDPLLIPSNIRQIWTPNPNEIHTGTVKIGGDTVTIENNTANTKFEATVDGTRIKNVNTQETTAEFTDKGVWTKHIEGESGDVGKLLIQDVGDQTWLNRR